MIAFIEHLVQHYGYGVIGLIICLEAMGLPLPGESLLIGSAIYAATTHKLTIEWVVLAAAIGAVMGDNFGYGIGHTLGRRALERYGPKVGLTVERQRVGQYLFMKHGGPVVFVARFVAFLRTFVALLAGANTMHWTRFLFWNAVGGITWTCLYGFGAYALGKQAHKIAGPVGITFGVIGVVVAVGVIWFLKKNEKRLVQQAKAEMEAYEKKQTERRSRRKQAA